MIERDYIRAPGIMCLSAMSVAAKEFSRPQGYESGTPTDVPTLISRGMLLGDAVSAGKNQCVNCGMFFDAKTRNAKFCCQTCAFKAKAPKNNDENGCWEWTASRNNKGYGMFRLGAKTIVAHRAAWIISYGPIPDGLCVLHRCDNPPCVNVGHLFLGTINDNNQDMKMKGRYATGDRSGARKHPERLATGDRHGWHTHPEALPRGEKRANAKLTNDAVLAIRRMSNSGISQKAIAQEFKVSIGCIRWVIGGFGWTHI